MRSAFSVGNEFVQCFVRLLLIDDDDHRIRGETRNGNEVGAGELWLSPEELVDLGKAGKRCYVGQERIAVGRSRGDELSADGTGGARFCLDDDRLLDDRFKRPNE